MDLPDSHALFRFTHLGDGVAAADFAFFQDAEIKPRPSAGCQQGRHARLVQPDANAVAGDAGLSDLEQGATDLVAITDTNCIIGQAFDGEILAELSGHEVGSFQLLLPVAIGVDLVDEDGALLTAVSGQIALTVAVQI